jgi:hypothetical protein
MKTAWQRIERVPPNGPEFNFFLCETTPRAAARLSLCRTEIARCEIRGESVEMLRRTGLLVAALAVAAGIAPAAAASQAPVNTSASAPYCGITWGSQAKTVGAVTADAQLTNIRAGRHGCYDRLVFDVRLGNVKWYSVKYVTAVRDESGQVVPLRGGAKLSITSLTADHDPMTGQPYPYPNRAELVNVSGYPTFRQVAWAQSDRHFTSFGLGVRARLPFRAFTLPGRLVIDVAHRW